MLYVCSFTDTLPAECTPHKQTQTHTHAHAHPPVTSKELRIISSNVSRRSLCWDCCCCWAQAVCGRENTTATVKQGRTVSSGGQRWHSGHKIQHVRAGLADLYGSVPLLILAQLYIVLTQRTQEVRLVVLCFINTYPRDKKDTLDTAWRRGVKFLS